MKTVNDLYKMSKPDNIEDHHPLLTEFESAQEVDWWAEYKDAYEVLDWQFKQQFSSFVFFDQDPEDSDEDIMTKWGMTIYSWLAMNDKRYSELYRIHVIPDDDSYALTNNYDLHETYSGNSTGASSVISGQRTDVTIDNIGSQNSENLNKISGNNSSSENTHDSSASQMGSREDTHQFTKGQEQDTSRSTGTDGHTMRRWGNIGVQAVQDMLNKQTNFWQLFNFYKIVFDDICKNFLLIGRM